MPSSLNISTALLCALLLSACALMPSQKMDWDHIDYAQLACGDGGSKSAGCKPASGDDSESLSNISKSSRR